MSESWTEREEVCEEEEDFPEILRCACDVPEWSIHTARPCPRQASAEDGLCNQCREEQKGWLDMKATQTRRKEILNDLHARRDAARS